MVELVSEKGIVVVAQFLVYPRPKNPFLTQCGGCSSEGRFARRTARPTYKARKRQATAIVAGLWNHRLRTAGPLGTRPQIEHALKRLDLVRLIIWTAGGTDVGDNGGGEGGRGNIQTWIIRQNETHPLIVDEEERPVLEDGSAHRSRPLVRIRKGARRATIV